MRLPFLLASTVAAADTLDIYVVDTEGGKAMILLTPDGETMLVDAGYPTQDDRDTKRIVEVAQAAGIKQFDYVVATHYDADHSGNVPRLDPRIPGKVFVDHGEPIPTLNARKQKQLLRALCQGDRPTEADVGQAGRRDPDERTTITVVTAGGKAISRAASRRRPAERLAPASRPTYQDRDDNAGSVGLLYEFGKFRMLDLADLLSPIEYDLVCPRNLVGTVDLFMVSHHGLKVSNSRFLVHALRPKVAIMNNGSHKGGARDAGRPEEFSGLQDLWQLHYSARAARRMP